MLQAADPGAPSPSIVILAALIKFDRFEWMIEKVTELGVKAVLPVEAARSEEGLFKAAAKRVERWRKIARESSQQSRRVQVPDIQDAVRLNQALRQAAGVKIRLEETPGAPPLEANVRRSGTAKTDLYVAIGPEGGWTDAERASMETLGWLPASLGNTIPASRDRRHRRRRSPEPGKRATNEHE